MSTVLYPSSRIASGSRPSGEPLPNAIPKPNPFYRRCRHARQARRRSRPARAGRPVRDPARALVPVGPLGPRFSGSTLALTSAGVLCAFAGTAAFALNLVLGGRIRFVESLFGGLDRMYRVHRQNGQIAFLLLAAHAFLVFAGRVTISVSSGFDLVTLRAGQGRPSPGSSR